MQGLSHASLVYAPDVCEFHGKNQNLFLWSLIFSCSAVSVHYGIAYTSLIHSRDKSIAQSGGYLF